jgi:ABC-type transport system involved in cytochrome bd biosynthesis fused ATPase/permease subunit
MKTATALTVIAIGAILAFAVTAQPSFFSFHVAGWVLMLTGIAGAAIPRRGYGWLRRRLVLKAAGQTKEIDLRQHHFSRLLVPGGLITEGGGVVSDDEAAEVPVESDTIEQYIEE